MENLNLIRKIAWSFHRTTGLDWDDLFQEAAYHYLRALKTYDPDKGVYLSTYVWNFVSNELKNYIKKEKEAHEPLDRLEVARSLTHAPDPYWERLSDEARNAAEDILDHPEQYSCLDPLNARLLLRYRLLQSNWPISQVREAVRDLKSAYSK